MTVDTLVPATPMEETLYGLQPAEPGSELIRHLARIATALEQLALDKSIAAPATPALAALPPVRTEPILSPASVCPIHKAPWKIVPAGVSKRTGNAYSAFAACPEKGCDQRPPS